MSMVGNAMAAYRPSSRKGGRKVEKQEEKRRKVLERKERKRQRQEERRRRKQREKKRRRAERERIRKEREKRRKQRQKAKGDSSELGRFPGTLSVRGKGRSRRIQWKKKPGHSKPPFEWLLSSME